MYEDLCSINYFIILRLQLIYNHWLITNLNLLIACLEYNVYSIIMYSNALERPPMWSS
jgi:hypothetical protein